MDSDTLTMMVRSLPQLQRIKCKSMSLSPKLEAVSATKRPHFVRQTYYPLEGSLMELDMWDPDMDAGKLVMFVLAVKLMCPSFAFANVAEGLVSKCRESFKEEKRNTHYRLYLHELANVHWRVTRQ
ncbi:hypothetical protein LPJ61_002320 [Coemansia biformis]|uniref:Uncharacterized protein n=1 Tax=Coemansia biformis TaxID=1286918 RepID=A0A9W7YDJ5_9FUNG|nr:hypothetical protein LPJ61_002320 [Coemansia biformis]